MILLTFGDGPNLDKVSVIFQGDEYNTISNNDGKWLVQTKHYLAGGPFSSKIKNEKEEIF